MDKENILQNNFIDYYISRHNWTPIEGGCRFVLKIGIIDFSGLSRISCKILKSRANTCLVMILSFEYSDSIDRSSKELSMVIPAQIGVHNHFKSVEDIVTHHSRVLKDKLIDSGKLNISEIEDLEILIDMIDRNAETDYTLWENEE